MINGDDVNTGKVGFIREKFILKFIRAFLILGICSEYSNCSESAWQADSETTYTLQTAIVNQF